MISLKNLLLEQSNPQVDGIIGQYTSKSKWPVRTDGTNTRDEWTPILTRYGLDMQKIKSWNEFVDWLKDNGHADSPKMNNIDYQHKIYQTYKKANPTFNLKFNTDKTSDDVRNIQRALIDYRGAVLKNYRDGDDSDKVEIPHRKNGQLTHDIYKNRTPEENKESIANFMKYWKAPGHITN